MKYKLLISDFDGTLARSDGTISPKTRNTIARFQQKGGIFAVCTGRMLPSILPRLKELGINSGLVVAFQGATVYEIQTGRLLKDEAYHADDAIPVIQTLERERLHFHVYTLDRFFANQRDEMLSVYEKLSGVTANIVTNELISTLVLREKLRVVKILVMLPPHEREALMCKLLKQLGESYYVTCSHEWMIEIMPKGQNKGEAVRFLSTYYGIPMGEIAAVGDQLNDLPMLHNAGGKYTVENGTDELKEIAQTIPSNDNDGVAYALEQIMEDCE